MFKRENLVMLSQVDKDAYDKLYKATREIRSDIMALDRPAASVEDRAIATVSILDDLEMFAVALAEANMSYRKNTGKYLTESAIPGLKYRRVRLKLSLELFRIMRNIYPETKTAKEW